MSRRFSEAEVSLDTELFMHPSDATNLEFGSYFLSDKDVAKRWHCSIKTLRNHRSLKKGCPFFRLGRLVRYRLSDVIAFEAAGKAGQ